MSTDFDRASPRDTTESSSYLWHLAASKPRQEMRAVENLQNQGIKAFSPVMSVEKIRAGKKQILEEIMFTGYVFVQLSIVDGLWHKVRSTRGIRDWVRFSGAVAKLPDELINNLIAEQNSPARQTIKKAFNPGEPVSILSGPFEGLKGVFQASNGEHRSMILIDFLGKLNRVKVENDQIVGE